MSAEELSAVTGMPAAEAAQFLEMAGGDLEAAVSLYFEMGAGGGGGDVPMGDAGFGGGGAAAFLPPTPAHTLLFGDEAAPASWQEQGFQFSEDPACAMGVVQHKNGPCGVLAAVNAIIVAQADCAAPSTIVSDEALSSALGSILVRCASAPSSAGEPGATSKVVIATWADDSKEQVLETELSADVEGVVAHLRTVINLFRAPGGANLLCYSAVLTRGLERVRAEMALDGSQPPLIIGPHSLCGTELMGLLMFGIARGNVSAYGGDGAKVAWRPKGDVGLLSRDEIEMGVPLADELKGPSKQVYVIHGGDHFTLLWATPNPSAAAGDGVVDFVHWNGLPPNRAMVNLRLRGASMEPPPPAPETHVQSHWRMKVGEVESIVQCSPLDKQARPGCWRTYSYELALATQAVVDEDKSEERPADIASPPSFEQGPPPADGEAWRCAGCYQTRFKTFCFGENPAPSTAICKFCGQDRANVGWTIWKKYDELPAGVQRRIDRTNGPKILCILRTRWPEAELSLFKGGAELPLGGEGFDPKEVVTPVA